VRVCPIVTYARLRARESVGATAASVGTRVSLRMRLSRPSFTFILAVRLLLRALLSLLVLLLLLVPLPLLLLLLLPPLAAAV
jgi:hypothetical protein